MTLAEAFNGLIQKVLSVFPTSPFAPYIEQFSEIPYLPWLNWFFPIKECLVVMAAWLAAVGIWYAYSIIARWVKVVGD